MISDLRIASIHRPPPVTITVDGRAMRAHPGESLAAALLAEGERNLGPGLDPARPRTVLCMMGVCQQCLLRVDGAVTQACLTPVRAGMRVERL